MSLGRFTGGGLGLGFSSDVLDPLTPGGGRRSLGGTTSGLYEGKSARGTSSTGRGKRRGSGSRRDGSTGGSPKSISHHQTNRVRERQRLRRLQCCQTFQQVCGASQQ